MRADRDFALDQETDHIQLVAGALVWAPYSWVYFNVLYQGILLPARIYTYAVGMSLARNAGGPPSGVDAWGRVGIDSVFLLTNTRLGGATDWELRVAATLRGRVWTNGIGTVAFGPRFIGSAADKPGLLATLSLNYDADSLIDSVMTSRPVK